MQVVSSDPVIHRMLATDLWSVRRRQSHAKVPAYVSSPWFYAPADRGHRPDGACQPDGSSARPAILALSMEMPKISIPRFRGKDYLADRKPAFQHFYPQKLMITVAKGCIIAAAQPLHVALQTLVDELEHDEDEDREPAVINWRELFHGYHYAVRRRHCTLPISCYVVFLIRVWFLTVLLADAVFSHLICRRVQSSSAISA